MSWPAEKVVSALEKQIEYPLGDDQMSKGSRVIAVRFPENELAPIMAELNRRLPKNIERGFGLSEFIRSACREKLAHIRRSLKSRKTISFTCAGCGDTFALANVGATMALLTGGEEAYCKDCVNFLKCADEAPPLGDSGHVVSTDRISSTE